MKWAACRPTLSDQTLIQGDSVYQTHPAMGYHAGGHNKMADCRGLVPLAEGTHSFAPRSGSLVRLRDVDAFEEQTPSHTHTDFANIPPRHRFSYFLLTWSSGYPSSHCVDAMW